MAKITRFSRYSNWIELEFVERERTPRELMQLGIRLYLPNLYILYTICKNGSSMSYTRGKQFMTGCKKLIYSWLPTRVRITLP